MDKFFTEENLKRLVYAGRGTFTTAAQTFVSPAAFAKWLKAADREALFVQLVAYVLVVLVCCLSTAHIGLHEYSDDSIGLLDTVPKLALVLGLRFLVFALVAHVVFSRLGGTAPFELYFIFWSFVCASLCLLFFLGLFAINIFQPSFEPFFTLPWLVGVQVFFIRSLYSGTRELCLLSPRRVAVGIAALFVMAGAVNVLSAGKKEEANDQLFILSPTLFEAEEISDCTKMSVPGRKGETELFRIRPVDTSQGQLSFNMEQLPSQVIIVAENAKACLDALPNQARLSPDFPFPRQ